MTWLLTEHSRLGEPGGKDFRSLWKTGPRPGDQSGLETWVWGLPVGGVSFLTPSVPQGVSATLHLHLSPLNPHQRRHGCRCSILNGSVWFHNFIPISRQSLHNTTVSGAQSSIFYPLWLHSCQGNPQNISSSLPAIWQNKLLFSTGKNLKAIKAAHRAVGCLLRSRAPHPVAGRPCIRCERPCTGGGGGGPVEGSLGLRMWVD